MSRGIKNHFHCAGNRFHHRLTDCGLKILYAFRDNPDKFNLRIVAGDTESSDYFHDADFMQGVLCAAVYRMFRGKPINAPRPVVGLQGIHNDYLVITVDQAKQVKTRRSSIQKLNSLREQDSCLFHMLNDVHSEAVIGTQGISYSQD